MSGAAQCREALDLWATLEDYTVALALQPDGRFVLVQLLEYTYADSDTQLTTSSALFCAGRYTRPWSSAFRPRALMALWALRLYGLPRDVRRVVLNLCSADDADTDTRLVADPASVFVREESHRNGDATVAHFVEGRRVAGPM